MMGVPGHGEWLVATEIGPTYDIEVAGCGRRRRPSSQPAILQWELGSQTSFVSVPEPGNWLFEAGSATSGTLAETAVAGGL